MAMGWKCNLDPLKILTSYSNVDDSTLQAGDVWFPEKPDLPWVITDGMVNNLNRRISDRFGTRHPVLIHGMRFFVLLFTFKKIQRLIFRHPLSNGCDIILTHLGGKTILILTHKKR